MTFTFLPSGAPVSSSFAKSAVYAVTASSLKLPVTASVAEFVVNYYGPVGPDGTTVNAFI